MSSSHILSIDETLLLFHRANVIMSLQFMLSQMIRMKCYCCFVKKETWATEKFGYIYFCEKPQKPTKK